MSELTSSGTVAFVDDLNTLGMLPGLGVEFYVGPPPAEVMTAVPIPIGTSGSTSVLLASAASPIAHDIDPAFADTLYLLDFFDRTDPTIPSHGEKVLEVAQLALANYGAP